MAEDGPGMDNVRVEREGEVLVVSINRPRVRNAVDVATAESLFHAFKAYDDDQTASVAVLTGIGGTFCAGADLKAVAAGERRNFAEDAPGPLGPTRLLLSKPVVAAVEGYAVAGGLKLANQFHARQSVQLPRSVSSRNGPTRDPIWTDFRRPWPCP